MKDVSVFYCKNCGEPLNLSTAKNNIIKCKYCSTEHILPKDDTSEEAKLYLHDGQRALDVGNFDEALTCFDKALEIEPFEPEGYFGKFLAKHKVQYLKDVVNNRLQPIVHDLINKDILDDSDYKKVCRFANDEQKEVYQKRVEEIDQIKKSFMELDKSKLDYDCFICVKVTDDETKTRTKDYKTAEDIYFALRHKGYKPFLSEMEIKERIGSDYEAMILYALMKSECMLVVCSNEEYLNTKWVKNEYTRFLKLVNDEVKASDAITIVFDGKPIEKLPGKKGKIQGINISSLDAMETIEKYVYNHTPKAKAERDDKERTKLEKEDELAKKLEEQAELIKKLQELQKKDGEEEQPKKEKSILNDEFRSAIKRDFIFDDKVKTKLIEYVGESTIVEIPNFVTSIGDSAFYGCDFITSIVIPNSVIKIEEDAFSDCTSLTSINIPNSVVSIGDSAFENCSSLTSIVIPNSVTSIGYGTFLGCSSLQTVYISNNITNIGESAFAECLSLTSITISNSVTSIGSNAFHGCSSLLSIEVPNSVISIGELAFYDCSALTFITIPNSVKSIENFAFSECSSLTIYCKARCQPSGWNSWWNDSKRPVYWSNQWSYVNDVPTPNK